MNFLLAIAALAALVWAPTLLFRVSLAIGCFAFFVVESCFGVEFHAFDVGPINLSIDRFFLLLLVASYAVQRWSGKAAPKALRGEDWLLGAFLGLATISAWTFRGDVPVSGVPTLQHLINGYLAPLAVFWIARQSKVDAQTLRRIYAGMTLFGVYLTLTGLLEVAGQWSLVFPRYIADPNLGIHFGRARGPMLNSVSYGVALTVCVACGWMLWRTSGRPVRLALLALAPAAAAALFFSYTRSIWLGAALMALAMTLATFPRRLRVATVGGAILLGLVVVGANWDRIMAFDRNDNTAEETRGSASVRTTFAYVSWKMFLDRPLLGFGFGQFPTAKAPYLSDRSTSMNLEAIRPYVHHNMFLSLLTELGLVGLLLFGAVIYCWTRGAWRLWRSAASPDWARMHGVLLIVALSVYLCQCLFHEMSFSPHDHVLLFFIAGLGASLRFQTPPAKASAPLDSSRSNKTISEASTPRSVQNA